MANKYLKMFSILSHREYKIKIKLSAGMAVVKKNTQFLLMFHNSRVIHSKTLTCTTDMLAQLSLVTYCSSQLRTEEIR